MSERLDHVARALAEPMPRRRALGVLGVTVVGLWTGGSARGAGRPLGKQQSSGCGAPYKVCSPATEYCHATCCPKHTICSIGPRSPRGCPIHPGCCDPCNPNGSSPDGNGGCIAGPVPSYCGARECKGPANRIDYVKTPSGADYGLRGQMRLGQTFTAREEMELTLGNGSWIKLEKGASFKVDACDNEDDPGTLRILGGRLWIKIKEAVGGGPFQFEAGPGGGGVRGTTFWVSYLPARKRMTVHVIKGSVEIWRRSSPKRKLLVKAGQTAVQQGNRLPRLTKR